MDYRGVAEVMISRAFDLDEDKMIAWVEDGFQIILVNYDMCFMSVDMVMEDDYEAESGPVVSDMSGIVLFPRSYVVIGRNTLAGPEGKLVVKMYRDPNAVLSFPPPPESLAGLDRRELQTFADAGRPEFDRDENDVITRVWTLYAPPQQ